MNLRDLGMAFNNNLLIGTASKDYERRVEAIDNAIEALPALGRALLEERWRLLLQLYPHMQELENAERAMNARFPNNDADEPTETK